MESWNTPNTMHLPGQWNGLLVDCGTLMATTNHQTSTRTAWPLRNSESRNSSTGHPNPYPNTLNIQRPKIFRPKAQRPKPHSKFQTLTPNQNPKIALSSAT